MTRVGPIALCAVTLLGGMAMAHDRTVSYSSWEIDGTRARVSAHLAPLDVSRLPWAATAGNDFDRRLGDYLVGSLTLRAGGEKCALSGGPTRLATTPDRIAFSWELTCPSARDLQLQAAVLREVAPSHLHFARLRLGDQPAVERVLSEAEPTWMIGDAGGRPVVGESLADFLRLGVEHILTGYDHLVFLLGLLLLGGSLRDVVRIVTGFTVAHSLTLALAVFGVLQPARAPIEALIGLSIALIAVENLWLAGGRPPAVRWVLGALLVLLAGLAARGSGTVPALTLGGVALFAVCYFGLVGRATRPAPLRAAVAFVFGLVHGFGFAGVLLESELPSAGVAQALFGFNVGVELGQVAAVLALWPLLQLARRYRDGVVQRAIIEYGSAAILAVGVFWFVSRSYG